MLYRENDFCGVAFGINVAEQYHCYVLDCFDKKAKSARWVAKDDYVIVFYSDMDTICSRYGTVDVSYDNLTMSKLDGAEPSVVMILWLTKSD